MEENAQNNPAISLTRKAEGFSASQCRGPANYLNEIETIWKGSCRSLEEEKTRITTGTCKPSTSPSRKCRAESIRPLTPDKKWNFEVFLPGFAGGTIKGAGRLKTKEKSTNTSPYPDEAI